MTILSFIAQPLVWYTLVMAQMMVQNSDMDLKLGFYVIPKHALAGSVIATYQVWDDFECSYRCAQHSNCLSFNYGSTTNKETGRCEINSSEKVLSPEKLLKNEDFHYYGILDHCLLSPCLCARCYNGGTCIMKARGKYGCKCPVEIASVPYIDQNCSVDKALIERTTATAGVFHTSVFGARYRWTFYEAQRVCEILGSTLATYDQLFKAWQDGMQQCRYGWLSDATARYPMQKVTPNCGGKIGITGSSEAIDKTTRYDAYCYS